MLVIEEKSHIEQVPVSNNANLSVQRRHYKIFPADQLLAMDFRPPEFLVANLIQQGLTILAGKPKVGKSLVALNIAIALMTGANAFGVIETEQRSVLYLALEDTPRRMKAKFATILNGYPANNHVHLAFQWSRMDASFFSDLMAFIEDHPDTKLVIVDTFTRIKGRKRPGATLYEKDYNEAALLKDFADNNGIAIMLIHHLRKSESKDILDMITGSVGLTGAADTIIALTRGRGEGEAILYATGRDIEETAFGLKFNKQFLTWEISGSAAEQKMGMERQAIYVLLKNVARPLKLGEIAKAEGKKRPVVHKHLAALIGDGLVKQPAYGVYEAVVECDQSHKSGETGETLINTKQQQ